MFESQEEAQGAMDKGEVREGHVVVIRYEGPKGGRVCLRCLPQHQRFKVAV